MYDDRRLQPVMPVPRPFPSYVSRGYLRPVPCNAASSGNPIFVTSSTIVKVYVQVKEKNSNVEWSVGAGTPCGARLPHRSELSSSSACRRGRAWPDAVCGAGRPYACRQRVSRPGHAGVLAHASRPELVGGLEHSIFHRIQGCQGCLRRIHPTQERPRSRQAAGFPPAMEAGPCAQGRRLPVCPDCLDRIRCS